VQWQLWATYTEIAATRWHYILAVDNAATLSVSSADLHLDLDPSPSQRYYEFRSVMGVDDYSSLKLYTGNSTISASTLPSFTITHLAPVLVPSPIVLLGERDKWVRVSSQRIEFISVEPNTVTVSLTGAGGESVTMDYAVQQGSGVGAVKSQACTLGQDGKASLLITADGAATCGARSQAVHAKRARRVRAGRQ